MRAGGSSPLPPGTPLKAKGKRRRRGERRKKRERKKKEPPLVMGLAPPLLTHAVPKSVESNCEEL